MLHKSATQPLLVSWCDAPPRIRQWNRNSSMDFVYAGVRPIRYSMIIALMGQNYPEHTYNHALFTNKVKVQTKIELLSELELLSQTQTAHDLFQWIPPMTSSLPHHSCSLTNKKGIGHFFLLSKLDIFFCQSQ